VIYALNPKKLYKTYKIYIKQFFLNIGKFLINFKKKTTKIYSLKKKLNLKKKSNKFCKKPKENICLLPLCNFSKVIFFTLFEKDIK